ncbi:MAG: DUF805 domain-containing protein [Propionibacteriaceae bacterium]
MSYQQPPTDPYGSSQQPYNPNSQPNGYQQPAVDPYQQPANPYAAPQGVQQPQVQWQQTGNPVTQQPGNPNSYMANNPYMAGQQQGTSAGWQPPVNAYVARPNMEFMQAMKAFFQNAFFFKGRASKTEAIFPLAIFFGIVIISNIIRVNNEKSALLLICALLVILMIVPIVALTVRRLHDINKTGWLALGLFVPLVNFILWILLSTAKSNPAGASFDDPTGKQPALGL